MRESWSYSQYSAALKCLRYFKLVYIDKIQSLQPESGDLAFGSSLHSSINSSLTNGDAESVFSIYWDSYKNKGLQYGRFNWSQLKELGLNFISKFERLHRKHYEFEFGETRLYAEYKGVRFEGTPDFYGLYRGKRSLRDFKTSGYNYDKGKSDVALQVSLYTYLCIQNGMKTPETQGYTVFSKGTGSIQDLTWDFSERLMHEHLDSVVEYLALMDKDRYPKNMNSCIMGSLKCSMWEVCHGKPADEA